MIKFNRRELHHQYKNIVKTCIKDGYCLPERIKKAKIPHQYVHTIDGKKGLFKHMDDPTREKLYTMIMNKKEELQRIRRNESDFESLDEYYDYELKEFLKEYPEFKNISKRK